jgi:hypothetical protein
MFYIDTDNYIMANVNNNNLELTCVVATTPTVKTVPLIIVTNDVLALDLIKSGTNVELMAEKNNDGIKYSLNANFTPTASGYVGLGTLAQKYSSINSQSEGTTAHSDHANVAEIARTIISKLGGFYTYSKSVSLTITTRYSYHAYHMVTAGDIVASVLSNGLTVNVGRLVDANITSEANNGGLLRIVTSGNHLLVTNDLVVLTKCNDILHDKSTKVTVINATTFDCQDIAYASAAGDSSAEVTKPAYLLVDASAAGNYHASFSFSFTGTDAKVYKVEIRQGVSAIDWIAAERTATGTVDTLAATGPIQALAGDKIWLSFANLTGTQDLVVTHMNLNMHKV